MANDELTTLDVVELFRKHGVSITEHTLWRWRTPRFQREGKPILKHKKAIMSGRVTYLKKDVERFIKENY